MNILSIESSCDDSALAYTERSSAKLLWHKKISQENTHKIYGGVVPELASRLFARDLPHLLQCFKEEYGFSNLSHIAVTCEPGLSTSLLEGVMLAKSLSLSLQIPLLGINHLKGHIYSLFINKPEVTLPLSVLLVSGGHTMIIECYNYNDMRVIGHTLDDSFGECYDKAAKMLGLGYPGGMIIDSIAQEAQKENVLQTQLPIPLINQNTLAFSFSGLKNAFRLHLQEKTQLKELIDSALLLQEKEKSKVDSAITESQYNQELSTIFSAIRTHCDTKSLVFGLQESATSHLVQKTKKYFQQSNKAIKYFAIVGGASANSMLRTKMQTLCMQFNKELLMSDLQYCSDNAAMIGRAAIEKLQNESYNKIHPVLLDISPRNTELIYP